MPIAAPLCDPSDDGNDMVPTTASPGEDTTGFLFGDLAHHITIEDRHRFAEMLYTIADLIVRGGDGSD